MPSVSEKQRRFMGAVLSYKLGDTKDVTDEVKKVADSMSVEQIKDFLEESINSLISEDSTYHQKYGRSKLFNITAMKDLIATNSFLENVYEKMKIRGKEMFGYHYNEIILSFIFLKYIKTNKDLFKRYLTFKKKATANIEKETEKQKAIQQGAEDALQKTQELTETDSFGTFGVGGIPSTPSFLAKNKQNWVGDKTPTGYNGTKVVKNKLDNPKKYTVQNKMNENFNELLNGELLVNKLLNESTKLNVSDIDIIDINGLDPLAFINKIKTDFVDETLEIKFVIDNEQFDEGYKYITLSLDDLYTYIRETFSDFEKSDDEYIETHVNYKMFQYYILDNMDKITQNVNETHSEDVEPELKEHHIESRENITTFILNKIDTYSEKQLDDMDYDSLYKIYLDIESKNFPNTETKPDLILGKTIMDENKTTKEKLEDIKHIIKREASKEKPDTELLKKLRQDMEELLKLTGDKEAVHEFFDFFKTDDKPMKMSAAQTSDVKSYISDLSSKLKGIQDKKEKKAIVSAYIKDKKIKDSEEIKDIFMSKELGLFENVSKEKMNKLFENKLRSVKVDFENGKTIRTSMNGKLTDDEILDYYKVGKTFNVGVAGNDDLSKVKSVEILNETKSIKDYPYMIRYSDGISQTKLDESYDFDKILEKINEESQHPAITNLNRIKSENEKGEENYFKSLNKGVQDGMKDTENGGKFEYEYDDLPKGDENMDEDKRTKEEIADGVKYKNSDAVEEFVKNNQGRDAYDLDFDIEPSKKWLDNLKKNIGDENYERMLKKMRQRKLERRYQRDVETQINPDRKKEQIDLTPNLPKLDEAEVKPMFMMGKFKNVFNETYFKRLDVNKANEIEVINENLTEFMVKGLGNTKTAKQVVNENGITTYETLHENVKAIDSYKFYINPDTLELFKVKRNKIM